MKARTKKARWLLIALLFGFLAVAGLTLFHHREPATIAEASKAAAPAHTNIQQPHATLPASSGGKHTLQRPVAIDLTRESVAATSPSSQQPQHPTGSPGAPASASNGPVWSNRVTAPTSGVISATAPQSNRPATPLSSRLPQELGNGLAYNGYAPLDCELPAGCGAGGAGSVSRRPAGTSGGTPIGSNTQGSSPTSNSSTQVTGGDTGQQTGNTGNTGNTGITGNNGNDGNTTDIGHTGNGGNTTDTSHTGNDGSTGDTQHTGNDGNTGDTGTSGLGSSTPGQKSDPVVAAPELDPATLAGAMTLLLGSLVVPRRRRVARADR